MVQPASYSGYAANAVAARLDSPISLNKEGRVANYAEKALNAGRVAVATASDVFFTVATFAEMVVRNLLAVLAKTAQFFIPKGRTEGFDNKVLMPAIASAAKGVKSFAKTAARVVTRFSGHDVNERIDNSVGSFVLSKGFRAVQNFHINGSHQAPARLALTDGSESASAPVDQAAAAITIQRAYREYAKKAPRKEELAAGNVSEMKEPTPAPLDRAAAATRIQRAYREYANKAPRKEAAPVESAANSGYVAGLRNVVSGAYHAIFG